MVGLASEEPLNRGDLRAEAVGGFCCGRLRLLAATARSGASGGMGGSRCSMACDKDQSHSMSASDSSESLVRGMLDHDAGYQHRVARGCNVQPTSR